MERRTIFPGRVLPILLVAPQLLLTAIFFLLPAGQAIWSSMTRSDAFGLRTVFIRLENFSDLFSDPLYVDSIGRTVLFCACVAAIAMEQNCARFEWSVLDWNQPSIDFYQSLGAVFLDEWRKMRVSGDALAELARMETKGVTDRQHPLLVKSVK